MKTSKLKQQKNKVRGQQLLRRLRFFRTNNTDNLAIITDLNAQVSDLTTQASLAETAMYAVQNDAAYASLDSATQTLVDNYLTNYP